MPHTMNIQSFLAGKLPDKPLLSVYCMLVATEIALKDNNVPWMSGHDVPQMLTSLNEAGLNSLAVQRILILRV